MDILQALGFVALVFVAGTVWAYLRLWRFRSRPGARDERDFAAQFAGDEVPPRVIKETFRYLKEQLPVERIGLNASDDLTNIFGIVDEDVDDAVTEIARRAGFREPRNQDVLGKAPVRTVRDLMLLIASLPSAEA